MAPKAPNFTSLLARDAQHGLGYLEEGWTGTVDVVVGPELLLPSGRLVACEPTGYAIGEPDELAFCERVPPGRYRVDLVVLDIVDADGHPIRRVNAAARLVVRDEPASMWRLALRAGEDEADLDEDGFFGYPVDGGMGGFASPEMLVALDDAPEDDYAGEFELFPNWPPPAIEALKRAAAELQDDDGSMDPVRAKGLRQFVEVARHIARLNHPGGPGEIGDCIDSATGANMVSFVSGWGDGHYATWVGYNVRDEIACFLTDFRAIRATES